MKVFLPALFGALLLISPVLAADSLNLAVMATDDLAKEQDRYNILARYLKIGNPTLAGINITVAKDYPAAVEMFRSGQVDGMFAGSFVAGILVAKGMAVPVARPLMIGGNSTYRAVIIARKGAKEFTSIVDLRGKKVACTPFASVGEIYLRSLLTTGLKLETFVTVVPTASHLLAIRAVQDGEADYGITSDILFEPNKYPDLVKVGGGTGSYPLSILVLTPKASEKFGKELKSNLLDLNIDKSPAGVQVMKAFGCQAFIKTGIEDFSHTFNLIKDAGIDPKTFDWKF